MVLDGEVEMLRGVPQRRSFGTLAAFIGPHRHALVRQVGQATSASGPAARPECASRRSAPAFWASPMPPTSASSGRWRLRPCPFSWPICLDSALRRACSSSVRVTCRPLRSVSSSVKRATSRKGCGCLAGCSSRAITAVEVAAHQGDVKHGRVFPEIQQKRDVGGQGPCISLCMRRARAGPGQKTWAARCATAPFKARARPAAGMLPGRQDREAENSAMDLSPRPSGSGKLDGAPRTPLHACRTPTAPSWPCSRLDHLLHQHVGGRSASRQAHPGPAFQPGSASQVVGGIHHVAPACPGARPVRAGGCCWSWWDCPPRSPRPPAGDSSFTASCRFCVA